MTKKVDDPGIKRETWVQRVISKLIPERKPSREDELIDNEDGFFEAITELAKIESGIKKAYEDGKPEGEIKVMESMRDALLRIIEVMKTKVLVGKAELRRAQISKMLDSPDIPEDVRKHIEDTILKKKGPKS